MNYNIVDICIGLDERIKITPGWKSFIEANKNHRQDILISFANPDLILDVVEMNYVNEKSCIMRCGESIIISNIRMDSIKILHQIKSYDTEILIIQIINAYASMRKMLLLHSSLIAFQGRGLMFLGPSGIGKTTQAELWNKYRDALIINGDIVFVQETEDGFLGWGTPWHGSSPYCENTSVPVKALVMLKQAPENSIRELTGFEKVTAVSNSVFYPRWLENGMELCLETLDHLLSALPVYELSCRPDEEAVRLTEEAVFGRG